MQPPGTLYRLFRAIETQGVAQRRQGDRVPCDVGPAALFALVMRWPSYDAVTATFALTDHDEG